MQSLGHEETDKLRELLRVGWDFGVEVTRAERSQRPIVSQVLCSALTVAYVHGIALDVWQPLAELVLEAAYEATLGAAVLNAQRGKSKTVLFTRLGGGAFGNADEWMDAAMKRALETMEAYGLRLEM